MYEKEKMRLDIDGDTLIIHGELGVVKQISFDDIWLISYSEQMEQFLISDGQYMQYVSMKGLYLLKSEIEMRDFLHLPNIQICHQINGATHVMSRTLHINKKKLKNYFIFRVFLSEDFNLVLFNQTYVTGDKITFKIGIRDMFDVSRRLNECLFASSQAVCDLSDKVDKLIISNRAMNKFLEDHPVVGTEYLKHKEHYEQLALSEFNSLGKPQI